MRLFNLRNKKYNRKVTANEQLYKYNKRKIYHVPRTREEIEWRKKHKLGKIKGIWGII